MNSNTLSSLYLDILSDIDISLLKPDQTSSRDAHDLSGLFLPSVPTNLHRAKQRIMIVGCETKAWSVLGKDEPFTNLQNYIEKSITKHKTFFEGQLKKKNARGNTFHNFTRSIAKECGEDGLIYSNLFCFSWKSGSPLKSPHIDTIKKYSEPLLKAQISFFKPHIIIFANGMQTASYRREIFPTEGSHKVCKNRKDYYSEHGIPKHHLWEFELYDEIRCFRIHHPSAQAKDAALARKFMLKLLASSSEAQTA
jgi:uracil-DNA glycosylase